MGTTSGFQRKLPKNERFAVHHLHNARLSMMNVGLGLPEISVAADKIVMNLGELTGNIWITHAKRMVRGKIRKLLSAPAATRDPSRIETEVPRESEGSMARSDGRPAPGRESRWPT